MAGHQRACPPFSDPEPAVEGPVLDGLADMVGGDAFAGGEVGDGAGDFEDAVVGAGAEVEVLHGVAEHFEGGIVDGAEFFDLAVRHAGV